MIPDSGEFLACTCVSGDYAAYIPLYVAAMLRAYPEAAVRILVDKLPLPEETVDALEIVASWVSDRFEVAAWTDRGLPPGDGRPIFAQTLRFLLGREHYAGFRYAMTADIDHLTIPQTPTLVQQHVAHARVLCMPYFNVMREPYDKVDDIGRMSGWHFIVVEPYFRTMQAVVERGRALLADLPDPVGRMGGYDEHVLYRLVREGLGVHEPSTVRPFRTNLHHGFHLGTPRIGDPWAEWFRDNNEWRRQGQALLADRAFAQILEYTPPRIRRLVESLGAFLAQPPLRPYEPVPEPEPL